MLPSICRHSCRLSLMKAQTLHRTATLATLRATPKTKTLELASHLIRRASTAPKKMTYSPKGPPPKGPPPRLSKIIIYHIGEPRIYMLGALKLSVVLIFGFIIAVVLPTYLEPEVPQWQAPLLIVAATLPVVAIWFLTYPMVMWMHIHVPQDIQRNKMLLERFLARPAANLGVYITTMGPLAKPRVTYVKLAELKPVKQRGGLVNYIRDVTQENKERNWYQYRAIGKFMIQDENEAKAGASVRRKLPRQWTWYSLIKDFRQLHGTRFR